MKIANPYEKGRECLRKRYGERGRAVETLSNREKCVIGSKR